MARQHGHPPVTFLGKGGSWIQNTLAPHCGSRWRCHGRVRLVLIFFLLIPFLFKQWWSGSGGPGRSQRVTTPHCSCGTTQTSRAWGAPPTDSVLEPELDTPQSQVKGGWLLLVCHFLDALQTLIVSGSELTSFTTSFVSISPQFGEVLLRSTFAQQPGSATAALAACNAMQAFQCVGGGERS